MAITDKQAKMVLHQEGITTSTLTPQASSARSIFVVLKQLHTGGGRLDEGALLANKEASPAGKSTTDPGVTGSQKVSMSLSAMASSDNSNQLLNWPAETTCKGITVTLDNNSMWNEFFRCQTEMILTKQGRRMFPYCRFRISGLEPFQRYTLVMDMQPVDNHRYRWSDRRWETNGKGDLHIFRSFVHPDSPATGLNWMQNPVSFYKLKLTNNTLDQEGHIIVNSMHRYLPRFHIIPADKATDIQLSGPDVITFSFPQTEFFAVTAYQNLCITQLKIDYNPFAKGFRDDATRTLNNLKSLFAKRNAAEKVCKGQNLPVPNNGDLKNANCDPLPTAEPDKCSSKKRPWPGGLSELIKGAHVKVKRISLDKVHGGSGQPMSICSLHAEEKKIDLASKDCKSENISFIAVANEETERKPKEENGTTDVKQGDTEGSVSFSKSEDSTTIENIAEVSSQTTGMPNNSDKTISDTSKSENMYTALSETITISDENVRENSQSVVKPLDCIEVKKKRAEPVPLPLLALFLQQLKSKTRPTKSKSETASSSHTDNSCNSTLAAENIAHSNTSYTSKFSNQSNTQTAAYPTSETIISPCTVACTTMSPSLLSTTLSSTSTTPHLPSIHMPLRCSLSLDITNALKVPGPTLVAKQKSTSAPDSVTSHDFMADFPDIVLLPTPEDVNVPAALVQNSVPITATAPDTNVTVFSDAPSGLACSCAHEPFPATTPNSQNNELSKVTTPETAVDPGTVPCSRPGPPQFPFSGDATLSSPSHAPSSPDLSLPSPAPSSPDPFPPSLFSDRPIPPRKSLDPFPPCLTLDRPRPPLELPDIVRHSFFITKPIPSGEQEPAVNSVSTEVPCPALSLESCVPKTTTQDLQDSTSTKAKLKRKSVKSKPSEDTEVPEGPIPVPMQPNLEDVEGQLFVSFISKKALEIHLGDEVKEDDLHETTEKIDGEVPNNLEERIDALEKVLLRDLKMMKHRQVIHPVLQEVGLKLNLLDLTLAIDLQYLGVCLPIPPPVLLPGASPGNSASSCIRFVSRTGKTTDFTKIKGWREKFTTSGSSSFPGVSTSLDTGQKNLSAFCSDMLDEYLESEGKLIDERADSFSKAAVSPVAYQMPTKSTSYVRTLDSVLKKQVPTTITHIKPYSASQKSTLVSKSKLGENTSKKSSRPVTEKTASSTDKPLSMSHIEASKLGSSLSKSARCGTSKTSSSELSAAVNLSQSKKSVKIKSKKGSKTSQAAVDGISQGSTSASPGSSTVGGRSAGLPKTLVKLMDVEDGAVWEGKHRTCITEERAAIALSSLVTVEAAMTGTPSTVIKRRAPPCLNDFCRLGCVCGSLAQERRQHHCGKPQCMLGCDCLRRKVVLLKTPAEDESPKEGPEPEGQSAENGVKVKKRKRRKTYILSGPEAAPEPATRVKMLWDRKNSDSECVFIPTPAQPHCPPLLSPELQEDLDNFLCSSPKKVMDSGDLNLSKDSKESWLTCARVRPFSRRRLSHTGRRAIKEDDPHLCSQSSAQEMEEGELRPPSLLGPTKRLEIVSRCKWATAGSRNIVLSVVCEHMAQDRLNSPFWIGKYRIEPVTKTVQETEEGSTITYKVVISEPHLVDSKVRKEEDERVKQLEALLIKTIGKSEVKGLPLLSQVTPAGVLKAETKLPGVPGQIWVNGKPYPQAKLELGQMGALHPANRLAAYITGRVYTAKQQASNIAATATISKMSRTTNPTTTTTSVAVTTSVTNTLSPTVITVMPTVTKPPVGSVFTQVVLNHINSQQQKLPCTSAGHIQSTIKNLIIPTSSLSTGATGFTLSPKTPPKADMAFQASTTPGSTDGSIPVTKAVPRSGSAAPEKKTFVLGASGPCAAQPAGEIRLMQPIVSTRPAVPGQRMVFQMLKTSNGNTLYRNPNGQLIQLVPLSQFRALNPNLLIPKQTALVRLPTPTPVPLSKPVNVSSTSSTITPSTTVTSTTQDQSLTPVHSTTTVTMTTTITSSVAAKQVISLSGSKSLEFSSQPNAVKIVPGFLHNIDTSTLRIVPQKIVQDPKVVKDPKITITTSATSDQNSSDVSPTNRGFVLLTPQTTQSQVLQGSNSTGHTFATPSRGTERDSKPSQCLSESPDKAIHADHSYTFETKECGSSPQMVGDAPKEGSDPANISGSHMLLKEVLALGPIETGEGSVTTGAIVVNEDGCKTGSVLEDGEIDSDCTELTEDSDMYDDTESARSSDQEDLCIVTDSNEGEKNMPQKRVFVDAEFQHLTEKDEEELVDIETLDERPERSSSLAELKQHEGHPNHKAKVESGDESPGKCRRRTQERVRRSTLKECFHKLHRTLSNCNHKASKMMILTQAQDEIESLTKKRNQLVKVQKKLRKKRVYFLQVASQLTGKSEESISQKLDEIVAKQKALESQNKAKGTNPDFIEQLIDSEEMGLGAKKKLEFEEKMKDSISIHAHLSSNSKPIDLSITKQKTLVFQDKGKDNDSVEQKTLEADDKGAQAFPRPCQPDKMLGLDTPAASHQTPHLGNSLPASRERTRPNILARSKSQMPPVSPVKDQVFVPQVIPLVQAVVPCNQIIAISNPLQPIGIASLEERQSTTPGVASVSISVPAVSHPIRVENPFPILQSQVLKITNSPLKINTPVKPISLPRISGVVSLVPPEKVIPPSLVLQKTDATAVSQGRAGFRPAVLEPLQSHSSNVVPSFQEGQGADRQQEGIVPKQPEQGTKVNITDAATSRKEEGKNTAGSNEPDDENLMSLLDELVFLNQQLNNESTQPEGGALNLTEAGEVPADLLTEKEAGVDVDDERSLSPLFLRLDEDLIASTTSKGDEIDDIPPKVDDLVKVIFGSDSPPNSSESEVVAVVSDGVSIGLVGPAKHDAPSLPPLLQMKAGGITIGDSLKEQASVAWRPMPKLAPLGLKTQEAGPPNAMNSLAVKPGSKLPSLQSANT
ncbi:MAX dimerization protein MGA a isoform X2 [Electrophorus electricus]|uniref:MAX dimerization protein MGA a isoform X2 n=1 Tax=Electrophorus electricus TaxID=8005 RepID=UPI0015CF94F8|nr:MAX dimerization protein MGA a isoform X2 [Electrophorus electricus]